ncbi:MAG TPA: site-specific integrase [Bryobacteraceae bacterium]|nr:site-specific integrase [Bryobacteraceae bacterium]
MGRSSKRGTGTVYQRGDWWWVAYWVNGKQFRESAKTKDEAEAKNFLKKRQGEAVTGRRLAGADRVTIGELMTLVADDYREQERRSITELKGRIEGHLTKRFGKLRAIDWTSEHRKQYIADRRREGAKNATINRELAIVRRAFTLGHRADPPLVLRVPFIAGLPENNIRNGFLEHEQYLKLLNELPQHSRLLLVLGYHTGMRRGELLGLRWDQVDLRAGQITLRRGETKNNRGRVCPVYGDMKAWLEMAHSTRNPKCPFIHQIDGHRLKSIKTGWKLACERADVHFRVHDLRRSAVRNMERAGIPRSIARSISGHLTESVYLRYDIVSTRDMLEAGRKMDRFLSEPSQKPSQSANEDLIQ